MKITAVVFLVLLGQCLTQEPCARLSEIIGEALTWFKRDHYVNMANGWRSREYVDMWAKMIHEETGIEIVSDAQRDAAICQAFGFTTLREVYDFISTNHQRRMRYSSVCRIYKSNVQRFEDGNMSEVNIELIEVVYNAAKKLSSWMYRSGFPENFPLSTDHETNIQDLNEILDLVYEPGADKFKRYYAARLVFTRLLPIGPDGFERTRSVDEVVGWMEDAEDIFIFASRIKQNYSTWFDVRVLKQSYDMLKVIQHNSDKVQLYLEAVKILTESNLFKLDTSDCEE